MNVEILSIGDELLIGDTINTNAAFIAQKLTDLGITIKWISTIGDDRQSLLESIRTSEKRADVVIATGGLGPTHDDITKKVFAEYFNAKLVLDEEILAKLKERFRRRNIPMAKSNIEQALVPDKAQIIPNSVGTASGLLFEHGGKYFIVLPGVPAEMKFMMDSFVIPFFASKVKTCYTKKILHTAGLPESTLFQKLGNVNELEKIAKIAFLPTNGGVDIRISKIGTSKKYCRTCVAQVEKLIHQKIHQNIWGMDDDTLEEIVVSKLIEQKKSISIIEIGTKGAIVARLSRSDAIGKVLTQAITFGSMDSLISYFNLASNFCDDEWIWRTEAPGLVTELLRKKTGSDIGMFAIHNAEWDITTIIGISDDRETRSEQFVFDLAPSINLHRITTMTLKMLYSHLTGQKIS